MYRRNFKGSSQIELELGAFHTPFTTRLNPQNRWVKLAGIIPWAQFEEHYSSAFGAQGRPAYPFRLAIGASAVLEKKMEAKEKKNDDRPGDSNDSTGQTHQGKLILDATCVPEDIRFPTDISLLNDAREATQRIIDQMWVSHLDPG